MGGIGSTKTCIPHLELNMNKHYLPVLGINKRPSMTRMCRSIGTKCPAFFDDDTISNSVLSKSLSGTSTEPKPITGSQHINLLRSGSRTTIVPSAAKP